MFRTEIIPGPSSGKIALTNKIICFGSCFADRIGHRLQQNKFNVFVNPGGIIYNPISIFKLFDYALGGEKPGKNSFLERDEMYYNYEFHSRISATGRQELEEKIENTLQQIEISLKQSDWLILTLGTSVIYRRKNDDEIVANCHKVPATEFKKEILTQKQILSEFHSTFEKINNLNPKLKILLTVSPVRHLKDSLEVNSVSKAILRITCDTLQKESDNVFYFPSFEIMMDDLRDYRFYERDLLHPSEEALDYIWEKFIQTFMIKETLDFIENWKDILKDLSHRPFNPKSLNHKTFLKHLLQKLEKVSSKVNVKEEIESIQKKIDA